jgi:hypothetical protein
MALAAQHGEVLRTLPAEAFVGAVMHFEIVCGVAAAAAVAIAPKRFETGGG